MTSVALTAVLFFSVLAPALAQSPAAFAGTWIAQFKGQTYARVNLSVTGGALQGRIGLAGTHFDADGVVDEIIPDAGYEAPIFDVSLRDGVLSFACKDGDDTDRFELRLVNGQATLTLFVDEAFRKELAQEGLPIPKPIPLVRTVP